MPNAYASFPVPKLKRALARNMGKAEAQMPWWKRCQYLEKILQIHQLLLRHKREEVGGLRAQLRRAQGRLALVRDPRPDRAIRRVAVCERQIAQLHDELEESRDTATFLVVQNDRLMDANDRLAALARRAGVEEGAIAGVLATVQARAESD